MPVNKPGKGAPAGNTDWGKIWASSSSSSEVLGRALAEEERSSRFGRILGRVAEEGLDLKGLRTVELGAGRGTVSLLLAARGADVTLVDSSEEAVSAARRLFGFAGLKGSFERADILDLPGVMLGKFDAAMSFGVAEHFTGGARAGVFSSHAAVLRPGGLAFISVPNARCLPYRVWKFAKEALGTWEYGTEVPFSEGELLRLCSAAGIGEAEVFGSGFLFALDRFSARGLLSRMGMDSAGDSRLDAGFGYALTVLGRKSGPDGGPDRQKSDKL